MEKLRIYDNGIYRDATPEEVKEFESLSYNPLVEIESCKAQLSATDYKAIKFAEGELTEEEYEPIRIERRNLRIKINELEREVNNGTV